ncbi:MAG: hypothetical protein M3243_03655 [Thermoproteota archaeon]|nr:hypothetical protein [Thermoproteota archaeon]
MRHNNKNTRSNKNFIARATAAIFLMLAITIVLVGGTAIFAPLTAPLQSAEAQKFIGSESNLTAERKLAPVVVSGDNIYIAWWTNNTENGNQEIMFRASNDGGATFGDKMNLSNTPDADSWRVELAGEGANVIVTWWETNQTSDTPVARISTDGGETFGAMLRLGANGTLTNTEEVGGEGEGAAGGETTEEEEAVGGAEVAE